MTWNLDNYEDVNARITRFRDEYPMGRLIADIVHIDIEQGRILVKATAYRTDDPNELPAAPLSTPCHLSCLDAHPCDLVTFASSCLCPTFFSFQLLPSLPFLQLHIFFDQLMVLS